METVRYNYLMRYFGVAGLFFYPVYISKLSSRKLTESAYVIVKYIRNPCINYDP